MYKSLAEFAEVRKKAVQDGLESPGLAALLVEKFAEGMLCSDQDVLKEADQLCMEIDPQYSKNRRLRYERFAGLDLSKPRGLARVR